MNNQLRDFESIINTTLFIPDLAVEGCQLSSWHHTDLQCTIRKTKEKSFRFQEAILYCPNDRNPKKDIRKPTQVRVEEIQ